MRKDTFAGCGSLRRVEVAEGCKLAIRYYLPQNVEVVTVPVKLSSAEDEPSSDFDEDDFDGTITLRENGDETMQKLQEQIQIDIKFQKEQQDKINWLEQVLANREAGAPVPTLPQLPEGTPEQYVGMVMAPEFPPPAFDTQIAQVEKEVPSTQNAKNVYQAQTECTQKLVENTEQRTANAPKQNYASAKTQQKESTDKARKQMLIDPHALVVLNGTEIIKKEQYKGKDYERAFIPKSVTQIGDSAFEGCKNLREVVVEEGSKLKTIGEGAFRNCNNFTKITFPEELEKVCLYAFQETGLESIEFPASLRRISQGVFYKCKNLRTVKFNEGLEVLGTNEYTDDGGMLHGAFQESALEKVELPSTLKKIQYWTFGNCKNLQHIELPNKLEYIGKRCFKGSVLESVNLPPALKVIEEETFIGCEKLKYVKFSEGLEKIELGVFCESGLESVELPASLRTVSQAAFTKCKSLKVVKFNEGLEVLGTEEYANDGGMWPGVFQESALEKVKLPSTLKRIEYNAFKNCKSLRNIALPEKLEYVGKQCFSGSALEFIRLPPALKIIENNTCHQCKNLGYMTFPEGLEKIGIGAFWESGLTHVELPASLRTVSQAAFAKCKNLRTVKFDNGLEVLGTDEYPDNGGMLCGVFQGSSIEHIGLPITLKRIEYCAFENCKTLKIVWVEKGCTLDVRKYVGDSVEVRFK